MSLGNITNFRLDMSPGVPTPIIHASAGDVGRAFKANLYWNSVPYDIQGNRVTIRGTKPDRTVFEYDVDDFDRDDSWVEFTIKEQMAIVPGKVLCELREYYGDDQIGSANFILDVETAVYDPEAASESYIPSFETAIEEALENVADDIADLATAAAINDVRQYSDAASASATAAASSAAAAAVSEQNAFSGTPDGYSALVSTVNTLNNKMPISITGASPIKYIHIGQFTGINNRSQVNLTFATYGLGQWQNVPSVIYYGMQYYLNNTNAIARKIEISNDQLSGFIFGVVVDGSTADIYLKTARYWNTFLLDLLSYKNFTPNVYTLDSEPSGFTECPITDY